MPKHIAHLIPIRQKLLNSYRQTKIRHLKPVLRSLTHQICELRRKWRSSIWQDKLLAWSDPLTANIKVAESATPTEQADILTDKVKTDTPLGLPPRTIASVCAHRPPSTPPCCPPFDGREKVGGTGRNPSDSATKAATQRIFPSTANL